MHLPLLSNRHCGRLLTLLVIIRIVLWQDLIGRAIAIIRESTRLFRDIPLMILWPLDKVMVV